MAYINGHKVESEKVNSNLDIVTIVTIECDAKLQQIHLGHGQMTLTGTAWDEAQRDLIKRTFPNLECKKGFSNGLTIWEFRGDN